MVVCKVVNAYYLHLMSEYIIQLNVLYMSKNKNYSN